MDIDVQKVRTRLEAKQTDLQHEIAALLDEEASLGQSGLGVEDTGETAQVLQDVLQDESILLNQRHLLAAIDAASGSPQAAGVGYWQRSRRRSSISAPAL